MKDPEAGKPERATAGFSLGRMLWSAARREDCIKAYKRVIKLTMTGAERRVGIRGAKGQITTAGEEFDEEYKNARNNLARLGALGDVPRPSDTGECVSLCVEVWTCTMTNLEVWIIFAPSVLSLGMPQALGRVGIYWYSFFIPQTSSLA